MALFGYCTSLLAVATIFAFATLAASTGFFFVHIPSYTYKVHLLYLKMHYRSSSFPYKIKMFSPNATLDHLATIQLFISLIGDSKKP